MRIIRRMNAYAQERSALQKSEECCVFHLCIARSALGFFAKQPGRRNKASRLEPMRAQLISCRHNATQSFVVAEVVKLALVLGVELCQKFVAQSFFCTARTFVKITVDDNFVTIRFQTSEPRYKLLVFCEQPLAMIIRHDKERTGAHAAIGQL